MTIKKENLARIYYAMETATHILNEGVEDFSSITGLENIEFELQKIKRNMDIAYQDMLDLYEKEGF